MGIRAVVIGAGVVLAVAAVAVGILIAVGKHQWRTETSRLHRLQDSAPRSERVTRYYPDQLDALPDPVKRYLQTVLTPRQSIISTVHILHSGTFNSK